MSKLTEKVVASQLINHICSNGLDEILQSAYKQFHSTETAWVKVFNDIVLDVDRNMTFIFLLSDLFRPLSIRLITLYWLRDLQTASVFAIYLWLGLNHTWATELILSAFVVRGLSRARCRAGYHRVPCLNRFYICYIPPHWGILSGDTRWAIISMLMILSWICLSILSAGMIKLILSLRFNPVLEISTVGCLVTNSSWIGTGRNCSLSVQNIGHAHL